MDGEQVITVACFTVTFSGIWLARQGNKESSFIIAVVWQGCQRGPIQNM